MAFIKSVFTYESKHEADIVTDTGVFRITSADLSANAYEEGAELTDAEAETLSACAEKLSCIKKAFTYLSYGDMSAKKLSQKLKDKFSSETVSSVVALMRERGYINDETNAARAAANFSSLKLWGRTRIKSELIMRGYDRESINAALGCVTDEACAENLRTLISKKYTPDDSGGINDMKIKAKLTAYLYRMGYSYGEINDALCAFEEQDG